MAFGKFERLASEKKTTSEASAEEKSLVLVIDDDINIRRMLSLHLGRKYAVDLCADGEEGLKNVRREVHVVILDIKMPGMDGFKVYDEIAPKHPEMPIIFFSAYQNILEGAKLSLKYKPFNYIDKSSDIKELFDSVDRAVESYKRILSMDDIVEHVKSIPRRSSEIV